MTDTFTIRATIARKTVKGLSLAEAIQFYNTLMEGDARDHALANTIERAWPNMADYDEDGSYIGSVSNENGWTA